MTAIGAGVDETGRLVRDPAGFLLQRDGGGRRTGRGLAEFHVQDGAARSLEGMGLAADGDGVERVNAGDHAACLEGAGPGCNLGGRQRVGAGWMRLC